MRARLDRGLRRVRPARCRPRSQIEAPTSPDRSRSRILPARGLSHLAPVLRSALAHYQFETLHPYGDGNGRIGRLVVVLQLLSDKALDFPALTVSPWFLKRRDEYQDHLLNVSCTGEWDPWITFFSNALRDQCMSLCAGAQRLIEWRDNAHRQVQARRWSGTIHQLLDGLLKWPVVTVSDTAASLEVSVVHATRMINHLVELGILHELTGKSYNRIFGAIDVMNIVEAI